MFSIYRAGAHMRAALGFLLLAGIASSASADVVTLNLAKSADAFNTSPTAPYPDGNYVNLSTNPSAFVVWHRYITSAAAYSNKRAAIDFVLPPVLLQPNIVINSAILTLPLNNESSSVYGTFVVHGIPSTSAPFTLADFPQNNPVATQPIVPLACCAAPPRVIEVKSWVQQRRDAGFDRAAFQLSASSDWGFNIAIYPSATLTVNYSAVIGSAPTLDMLAPSSGSAFVQGEQITFSAVANDAEDGSLDASIEWASSINGSLGTGSTVLTTALNKGSHVITARVTDSNGNVISKALNLTILPNTNTPPTITVAMPAENSTSMQDSYVFFQATASDFEDGNITAAIVWTSSLNGALDTGGNFGRAALSIGAHVITASITDSQGNTTTAVRNITVQAPANMVPTVSIASPTNGASLTAGVSFTLSGYANDPQQGNMSSSIQWLLNGTTVIATGASGTATISNPGSYSIVARVTDNGGLTGSQTVNVTVASGPPPPPADYCTLRSNSANSEHIAGVRSGTTFNNSGANINGYVNFTGLTFHWPVGSNPLTLVPGFSSSSHLVRWVVWIDLNRDRVFSANEQRYYAMSSLTINTSIVIPVGTALRPDAHARGVELRHDAPGLRHVPVRRSRGLHGEHRLDVGHAHLLRVARYQLVERVAPVLPDQQQHLAAHGQQRRVSRLHGGLADFAAARLQLHRRLPVFRGRRDADGILERVDRLQQRRHVRGVGADVELQLVRQLHVQRLRRADQPESRAEDAHAHPDEAWQRADVGVRDVRVR